MSIIERAASVFRYVVSYLYVPSVVVDFVVVCSKDSVMMIMTGVNDDDA